MAPGPPLTPPEPAPPGTRSQTLRHSGPRTQPLAGGASPGPASAAGRGRALGGRGYRAGTAYLRLGRGSRRSHPRGGRPPGSRPHRRRHDPAAARRPLVAGATGAGPGSLGWGSEHHAQRLPVRSRVPSWERAGTRWRWERGDPGRAAAGRSAGKARGGALNHRVETDSFLLVRVKKKKRKKKQVKRTSVRGSDHCEHIASSQ